LPTCRESVTLASTGPGLDVLGGKKRGGKREGEKRADEKPYRQLCWDYPLSNQTCTRRPFLVNTTPFLPVMIDQKRKGRKRRREGGGGGRGYPGGTRFYAAFQSPSIHFTPNPEMGGGKGGEEKKKKKKGNESLQVPLLRNCFFRRKQIAWEKNV